MSQLGDFMRDAAQPALMGLLGDCLLRFPSGDQNRPVRVEGIWAEDDPSRFEKQGDRAVRCGLLKINDGVPVMLSDTWQINGYIWSVEKMERIEGSFRHLRLSRQEKRQTKPHMQS